MTYAHLEGYKQTLLAGGKTELSSSFSFLLSLILPSPFLLLSSLARLFFDIPPSTSPFKILSRWYARRMLRLDANQV